MADEKNEAPPAENGAALHVKLGDVYNSYPVLKWLAGARDDKKAPPAWLSMALFETLSAVDPKIKNYEKVLDGLRETYLNPVQNDKGEILAGQFRKKDAQSNDFDREFEGLNEMSVALPVHQVSLAALEKHGISLTGAQIYALRWLLKLDVAAKYEDDTPPKKSGRVSGEG